MSNIEFHSQEWWVNRVQFWKDMIDENTIVIEEIDAIAQKNWNNEQRSDIRTSREAVKHAQGNLKVAERKVEV